MPISRSLLSLVAAGALSLSAAAAEAAFMPQPGENYAPQNVQMAWCAVGAHIGPIGGCVGGYGPGWRRGYWRHCWINRWGRRVCN
jgi:hypothetical protein